MGLPIVPAKPPAAPAQNTVELVLNFCLPVFCCTCLASISYSANRAVEYVVCRRTEADSPDQREVMPSVWSDSASFSSLFFLSYHL